MISLTNISSPKGCTGGDIKQQEHNDEKGMARREEAGASSHVGSVGRWVGGSVNAGSYELSTMDDEAHRKDLDMWTASPRSPVKSRQVP